MSTPSPSLSPKVEFAPAPLPSSIAASGIPSTSRPSTSSTRSSTHQAVTPANTKSNGNGNMNGSRNDNNQINEKRDAAQARQGGEGGAGKGGFRRRLLSLPLFGSNNSSSSNPPSIHDLTKDDNNNAITTKQKQESKPTNKALSPDRTSLSSHSSEEEEVLSPSDQSDSDSTADSDIINPASDTGASLPHSRSELDLPAIVGGRGAGNQSRSQVTLSSVGGGDSGEGNIANDTNDSNPPKETEEGRPFKGLSKHKSKSKSLSFWPFDFSNLNPNFNLNLSSSSNNNNQLPGPHHAPTLSESDLLPGNGKPTSPHHATSPPNKLSKPRRSTSRPTPARERWQVVEDDEASNSVENERPNLNSPSVTAAATTFRTSTGGVGALKRKPSKLSKKLAPNRGQASNHQQNDGEVDQNVTSEVDDKDDSKTPKARSHPKPIKRPKAFSRSSSKPPHHNIANKPQKPSRADRHAFDSARVIYSMIAGWQEPDWSDYFLQPAIEGGKQVVDDVVENVGGGGAGDLSVEGGAGRWDPVGLEWGVYKGVEGVVDLVRSDDGTEAEEDGGGRGCGKEGNKVRKPESKEKGKETEKEDVSNNINNMIPTASSPLISPSVAQTSAPFQPAPSHPSKPRVSTIGVGSKDLKKVKGRLMKPDDARRIVKMLREMEVDVEVEEEDDDNHEGDGVVKDDGNGAKKKFIPLGSKSEPPHPVSAPPQHQHPPASVNSNGTTGTPDKERKKKTKRVVKKGRPSARKICLECGEDEAVQRIREGKGKVALEKTTEKNTSEQETGGKEKDDDDDDDGSSRPVIHRSKTLGPGVDPEDFSPPGEGQLKSQVPDSSFGKDDSELPSSPPPSSPNIVPSKLPSSASTALTTAKQKPSSSFPPFQSLLSIPSLVPTPTNLITTGVANSGVFDVMAKGAEALVGGSQEGNDVPTDKMSIFVYWWGYELYLPPPTLSHLQSAHSLSGSLFSFLSSFAVAGGVPELQPFVRYISMWVDMEWKAIQSQNKGGRGVVLASTWILPIAIVPRPWDV